MIATDARWAEAERASEARHGGRRITASGARWAGGQVLAGLARADARGADDSHPLFPEAALTWPIVLAAQGGITPAERFLLVGNAA